VGKGLEQPVKLPGLGRVGVKTAAKAFCPMDIVYRPGAYMLHGIGRIDDYLVSTLGLYGIGARAFE